MTKETDQLVADNKKLDSLLREFRDKFYAFQEMYPEAAGGLHVWKYMIKQIDELIGP